jgi:hypothetical protein
VKTYRARRGGQQVTTPAAAGIRHTHLTRRVYVRAYANASRAATLLTRAGACITLALRRATSAAVPVTRTGAEASPLAAAAANPLRYAYGACCAWVSTSGCRRCYLQLLSVVLVVARVLVPSCGGCDGRPSSAGLCSGCVTLGGKFIRNSLDGLIQHTGSQVFGAPGGHSLKPPRCPTFGVPLFSSTHRPSAWGPAPAVTRNSKCGAGAAVSFQLLSLSHHPLSPSFLPEAGTGGSAWWSLQVVQVSRLSPQLSTGARARPK